VSNSAESSSFTSNTAENLSTTLRGTVLTSRTHPDTDSSVNVKLFAEFFSS